MTTAALDQHLVVRQLPTLYREGTIEARAEVDARADKKKAPLEMTLSSEAEVVRYGWFGERWVEILDHSAEAVVMDYARDGLPLLLNHDVDQQVGSIGDLRIRSGRLRGDMQFSQGARGQEIEQDVRDRIRKNASIGYRVLDLVLERSDKETGIDYYRVTKWVPLEGSIVGVPADISVGVGRSVEPEALWSVNVRSVSPSALGGHGGHMSGTTAAAEGSADTALEITRLAREHGFMSEVPEWLERHTSLEQVKTEIITKLKKRMATQDTTPRAIVDLSPAEASRFNYARAILGNCDQPGVDSGFEREVATEIRKKLPSDYKGHGGILLPTMLRAPAEEDFVRAAIARERDPLARAMMVRAGLDSITSTKGSELKFTQAGDFIPMLRNKLKVALLGAQLLSGLAGPVSFPKQTNAASGSWVVENPGADVADSNLLLTTVTLSLKTYMASTSFSRQLLVSALSASVDAEQMVREDLVNIARLAIDLAAINGSGAANQPRGILNTSGVGLVAIGTNGGAPLWDHLVDSLTATSAANADTDRLGFLTTPGIRGRLLKTPKLTGTTSGLTVWGDGPTPLIGYPAEVSNQVPSTLTKGTSTDCHAIIFGAWPSCIIGEWGALELVVDPYRLKKQAMIEVTLYVTADVALRWPEAFTKIVDARTV